MNKFSAYKLEIDNIPEVFQESLLSFRNPLEQKLNKVIKRTFDIFFALMVIILLLSWLLPLLAILIKLTSKGPVLFIQARTGYNNKTFNCWKLRSMILNKEANEKQATLNDRRITLAGKYLRKYSLDELPQFFNVLVGDMSIIGPRPHMLHHTKTFTEKVSFYNIRHNVKPGITGLAQTLGYRGEITDKRELHNRVRLDLFYIQKWSFGFDLYLIIKTFLLLIHIKRNVR